MQGEGEAVKRETVGGMRAGDRVVRAILCKLMIHGNAYSSLLMLLGRKHELSNSITIMTFLIHGRITNRLKPHVQTNPYCPMILNSACHNKPCKLTDSSTGMLGMRELGRGRELSMKSVKWRERNKHTRSYTGQQNLASHQHFNNICKIQIRSTVLHMILKCRILKCPIFLVRTFLHRHIQHSNSLMRIQLNNLGSRILRPSIRLRRFRSLLLVAMHHCFQIICVTARLI